MQSQRILTAAEITQLIGAAFSYNNLDAVDVAFDISGGDLRAIVTVEEAPLEVADQPPSTVMDGMSRDMLRKMQERASGRN